MKNEDIESVEDFIAEVDKAVMSGVCPQCGCGLESFEDKNGSGLRCCKCSWSVYFPKR